MQQRQAFARRFANKVAIVTGGCSGIGEATVHELWKEGASVVIADLNQEKGVDLEKALNESELRALFLHGDLADGAFIDQVVLAALDRFGRIDYLVNNAFSYIAKGADATFEEWRRIFEVGPIAYASLSSRAAEAMKLQGGGAIVNVSSISAFVAQPGRWTYNSAKGAVNTLTKCMALDFAKASIRVNSVSPGWIWTQEVLKAAGGDRDKWDPIWGQFHMLGRCGNPVEVAAAILFLLSDDASFITGADLPVDGGYQGLGSEGTGAMSHFAGSN